MRFPKLILLLTIVALVLLWSSCDAGTPTGGRGSVGPGTTATYLVFTDGSRVNVESINPNGTLTSILGSPYTAGNQTSAVAITPDGRFVYVLNTASNSVTQFKIISDGTMTTVGADQLTGTEPVAIAVDSQQRFVAVANKTAGTVSIFRIDTTTGALLQIGASPVTTGNNPVAVTIRNNFVFAVAPTSIAVFAIDPVNFTVATTVNSPFAAGAVGALSGASAGIQLYTLDSTNNTVQNYTLDVSNGTPTPGTSIAAGTTPAAILQVLGGRFLYVANRGSNNVSGYSIDGTTGALTALPGSPFTAGTAPATLAFDSVNNLLLVGNTGSSNLSVYSVNTNTGVLTSTGAPIPLGGSVNFVAVAKP